MGGEIGLEAKQKRKLQKKNRKKKTFLTSFLFFFVIFISGALAFLFWQVDLTLNDITVEKPMDTSTAERDQLGKGISTTIPKVSAEEENTRTNILILGLDHRPKLGTRNTDVIMVASLDEKEKTGALISIPRDTKIYFGELGQNVKANYVFSYGEKIGPNRDILDGLSMAKQVFSNYLDVPIDHAVVIDFDAFKEVIDELGGITVDVERSMQYDDPVDGTNIDLQPGVQKLDGEQSLNYVRFRMDNRGEKYYSNDFERNIRQQKVLQIIIDKVSSFDGLKNFLGLLKVAGTNVQTDFTKDELTDMILTYKGFTTDQLMIIDNQGYWDSKQGFSIIPTEVLEQVRQIYAHP